MNDTGAEKQAIAAQLYAEHGERLLRAVRYAIRTSEQNVEDACSFAWLQLLKSEPECGERIFAWLRAVAIHEALRLDGRDRRPEPMDEVNAERLADSGAADPELALELENAFATVGSLPPRPRRILGLKVAGFSYDEIAELTDDSWRTIDRQLVRARRTIRDRR